MLIYKHSFKTKLEREVFCMVTQFGKFCRKLRIEREEILKDMSDKLGVTSAYLSSVENAKRNVPKDWEEKLSKIYKLSKNQKKELKAAIIATQKEVTLRVNTKDKERQEFAVQLARKFDTLTRDEITKISEILKRGEK